jgi:hypothetical protein
MRIVGQRLRFNSAIPAQCGKPPTRPVLPDSVAPAHGLSVQCGLKVEDPPAQVFTPWSPLVDLPTLVERVLSRFIDLARMARVSLWLSVLRACHADETARPAKPPGRIVTSSTRVTRGPNDSRLPACHRGALAWA